MAGAMAGAYEPLVVPPRPRIRFVVLLLPLAVAGAALFGVLFAYRRRAAINIESVGSTFELFATYAASDRATPLVVDLHGLTGTPFGHRRLSGVDEIARERGWHALWPSGFQRSWNAGRGLYPPASWIGIDHVAALTERIEQIKNAYNVSDVVLSGYSNGCAMVYRLLSEAAPYTYAAAVCVAHFRPNFKIAAFPTPLLVITGENDELSSKRTQMDETLVMLREENRCGEAFINTSILARTTFFSRCTRPLVHARLHGRGHGVYGQATTELQRAFLNEAVAK